MSKRSKEIVLEVDDREKAKLLEEAIIVETRRPNGTVRIQQDFAHCPSLTEQHSAHLTNINYLMAKYRPDELAAYLMARGQYRAEILGHDFSNELSLMEAKNVVLQSRQAFEELPTKIKEKFGNHVQFIKFIDDPANVDKMIELGILSRKQIDAVKIETAPVSPAPIES